MTDSDITRRRLISALAAAGAAGLAGCGGDGTDASNVSDNEAATGTEAEGVTEGQGEALNEEAGTPQRDPDNQTGENDTDADETTESDRQITVSVVNAVAGADPLTVTVDGDSVVSDAGFGEVSESIVLEPGDHTVRLRSGDETLSEDTVTLEQGRYTGVAMGERDGERDVAFEAYPVDAGETGEDEAAVRLVHAAPDAPALDVTSRDERLFEGVEYGGASEFVTLPPREYELAVRESGSDQGDGLDSFQVDLTEHGVYTVVALGYLGADGGDTGFQVVLVRGGEVGDADGGAGDSGDGTETDGDGAAGNESAGGTETDGNESGLVSLLGGLAAL